jgi:hypothetical protein
MTEFFGVKFIGSKSKYGSVEPPNGICVAELILCDAFYMALLSHILLRPLAHYCKTRTDFVNVHTSLHLHHPHV